MPTPHSILIVDDEFGLAEMLCEMLRELGYDVQLAINGRLAFEILGERPVDVVITDLMMPVMDGNDLAAAIRASERLRKIPIVLMTSLPSAGSGGTELFDAVLRKPFTPDLLLATLDECLAETSRAPSLPAGEPAPSPPFREPSSDSAGD